MNACKGCVFWDETFPAPEDADEDRLGSCTYMVPIPHAWRWCLRERVGVYANEGADCPAFKPKE